MRPAYRVLAAFEAGIGAVVAALAVCQVWLLWAVDELYWCFREPEKRCYFFPGEVPLMLVTTAVVISPAVWATLRLFRSRWPLSRRTALCLAVPTALAGLTVFEVLLSRALPNPVGMHTLPIWAPAVLGATVGAFGRGGSATEDRATAPKMLD